MKDATFDILQKLGYKGSKEDPAQTAISWLASEEIIRIEPYWHFLGADGGFSWSKSWEEFSDKKEVPCEKWEDLLEIALEVSLEEAFGDNCYKDNQQRD